MNFRRSKQLKQYHLTLTAIFTDDAFVEVLETNRWRSRARDEDDPEPDESLNAAEAVSLFARKEWRLVTLLRPAATASVLAHEAVHLASFCYGRIGSKMDVRNDEAFAHLVEEIVDWLESVQGQAA